jgi:hypothetical protein
MHPPPAESGGDDPPPERDRDQRERGYAGHARRPAEQLEHDEPHEQDVDAHPRGARVAAHDELEVELEQRRHGDRRRGEEAEACSAMPAQARDRNTARELVAHGPVGGDGDGERLERTFLAQRNRRLRRHGDGPALCREVGRVVAFHDISGHRGPDEQHAPMRASSRGRGGANKNP